MSEVLSSEPLDALPFDPEVVYPYEQQRIMYQAAVDGALEIARFHLNRTASEPNPFYKNKQVHLYDPQTDALTHIEHIASSDEVESIRISEQYTGKRAVNSPDGQYYRTISIDVRDAAVIGHSTVFDPVQLESWNTGLTRSKPVQELDFVDALDLSRIDPIEEPMDYLCSTLHRANVMTRLRQQASAAVEAEFNGDPDSCSVTIVEAPTGPTARTRNIARKAATVGLAASVAFPLTPSVLDSLHESFVAPVTEVIRKFTDPGLEEPFGRRIDIIYPVSDHVGAPEPFNYISD